MAISRSLNTAEQVPHENYRKVFRASQRNIERELGNVLSVSADLQKRSKGEDAVKAVDGMITRVENLKRKVGCSCRLSVMSE